MKSQELAQKVVVARSKEGNFELQDRLSDLGIKTVAVETIRFEEPVDWSRVDEAIRRIGEFDWVAFTSPRAVVAFGRRMRRLGIEGRRPKFAAVGRSTAASLERLGFNVDFVPRDYLTEALGVELPARKGDRVLLLRTDIGEKRLLNSLRERGVDVTDLAIYLTKTAPGKVDPEGVKGASLVAFASPSEVRAFRERLGAEEFRELAKGAAAVCIGPVTAEAAREAGFGRVISSEEHTVEGLVDKVREAVLHA
jgi:uroporphyrinogen III methyltransferase / synthase